MHNATVVYDAELQGADAIHTVDPQDPDAAGHELWGHHSEKSQVQPDNSQRIVEVPLPSDDHVALLALIDRIEVLKGSLPPDIEVLRRNLAS